MKFKISKREYTKLHHPKRVDATIRFSGFHWNREEPAVTSDGCLADVMINHDVSKWKHVHSSKMGALNRLFGFQKGAASVIPTCHFSCNEYLESGLLFLMSRFSSWKWRNFYWRVAFDKSRAFYEVRYIHACECGLIKKRTFQAPMNQAGPSCGTLLGEGGAIRHENGWRGEGSVPVNTVLLSLLQ